MPSPIINKSGPKLQKSQVGLIKSPVSIKCINKTPGIEINTAFKLHSNLNPNSTLDNQAEVLNQVMTPRPLPLYPDRQNPSILEQDQK